MIKYFLRELSSRVGRIKLFLSVGDSGVHEEDTDCHLRADTVSGAKHYLSCRRAGGEDEGVFIIFVLILLVVSNIISLAGVLAVSMDDVFIIIINFVLILLVVPNIISLAGVLTVRTECLSSS